MDVAVITGLVKLVGDGLFAVIITLLYIMDKKKRDKEYKQEREILQNDYETMKKNREEEYKTISENYNNMVMDIINGINAHYLTPEEGKSIAQVEKQINDTVKIMLKDTNASRVGIVKYHNGMKDMTGTSFLKMSMTNEAVKIGVTPLMPDFQNHFRSLLAYWCHEIDINEECVIADTRDLIDEDATMYEYLTTRNIEASYGMALKDTRGNIIGFICVEYLDKYDFKENIVKEVIKSNKIKLETLIDLNGGVNYELQ